jgi:hypothetical protein
MLTTVAGRSIEDPSVWRIAAITSIRIQNINTVNYMLYLVHLFGTHAKIEPTQAFCKIVLADIVYCVNILNPNTSNGCNSPNRRIFWVASLFAPVPGLCLHWEYSRYPNLPFRPGFTPQPSTTKPESSTGLHPIFHSSSQLFFKLLYYKFSLNVNGVLNIYSQLGLCCITTWNNTTVIHRSRFISVLLI